MTDIKKECTAENLLMKKVQAVVTGRVQGVGFRFSTQQQAQQLGLVGFVRNLSNGDVELVAVGASTKVDALIVWAKSGPPSAQVKSLRSKDQEYLAGEFSNFAILR